MIEQCRGLIRKRTNGSELVNYNIPNFPSYVHRGWILPNVTWEKVTHYHEDIELLYVLSGKMAYNVPFVRRKLQLLHDILVALQ